MTCLGFGSLLDVMIEVVLVLVVITVAEQLRPCQFYRWIDPPTPEHLVPVLIELCDQVRAMRTANRQGNGHMDLALVDAAFVDAKASRQQ